VKNRSVAVSILERVTCEIRPLAYESGNSSALLKDPTNSTKNFRIDGIGTGKVLNVKQIGWFDSDCPTHQAAVLLQSWPGAPGWAVDYTK
jgi:hypothetical protein